MDCLCDSSFFLPAPAWWQWDSISCSSQILATEDLNEDALLRIFDGVTAAFYKSDEYNSREYRYSNLSELRKAMKHKGGGTNGKAQ